MTTNRIIHAANQVIGKVCSVIYSGGSVPIRLFYGDSLELPCPCTCEAEHHSVRQNAIEILRILHLQTLKVLLLCCLYKLLETKQTPHHVNTIVGIQLEPSAKLYGKEVGKEEQEYLPSGHRRAVICKF